MLSFSVKDKVQSLILINLYNIIIIPFLIEKGHMFLNIFCNFSTKIKSHTDSLMCVNFYNFVLPLKELRDKMRK